jgi:adenylate kinase
VHAEIIQVVADEARESYDESIVLELSSNASEEVAQNVETIAQALETLHRQGHL